MHPWAARAWRAGTLLPLLAAVHELLVGVEAGPVANARACALDDGGGGGAAVLVARRARAARGALVVFSRPDGGGAAAAVVRGVPGDVAEGARGLRLLAPGELWVVAPSGGGGARAVDSETFGPLPRALVRGVPVAALSWRGARAVYGGGA